LNCAAGALPFTDEYPPHAFLAFLCDFASLRDAKSFRVFKRTKRNIADTIRSHRTLRVVAPLAEKRTILKAVDYDNDYDNDNER